MSVLAITGVYKNAYKVENVFFARLGWVTEVIDMICADVDRRRKLEVIVNLSSAKIVQIEFEPLEMKDEIIRHFLKTGSISISFASERLPIELTSLQHRQIYHRTTRTCIYCRLP